MKKNYLFILLFLFLIGINSVNAMTLKPAGDSTGKRGGQVTVYIRLDRSDSEKTVSAVDGTFSYDSNVLTMVKSEKVISDWTEFSTVTNNGTFSYANLTFDKLITGTSQNIAKVIFKVNDSASYGGTTISVTNPSATDENGYGVSISGASHTVKVLSDVNTLTGITVSGATINFNENTTSYDMTIDNTSTNIVATKKDSGSTISGDIGNKNLNYGKNVFKIAVTSESGVKKEYTLNITRPDNRSKTNTLDSLKLSEGKINFNKDTLKYNLTVENKVTSIEVDATLTDSKSSFVSGYGPRSVVLKEGTNSILIKVKAENEEVKTYTITVTRKSDGTKSDNNYLSEITLSEGTIDFSKDELEYTVVVLYDVEDIEITAKTEDSKAKYEIDGETKLKVGENKFIITVTAESGATREYVVIVDRKSENEVLSNNTKLNKLTISGYQLNFDSDVYEYNLKIEDESSLVIEYDLDDEKSSVNIDGNSDLQNGSIIRVTVTAEDGSTSTYKISIEKEEGSNVLLFVIIGGVVLILLVIIVIIISKSKKNKNNENIVANNHNNNGNDLPINQNNQYWGAQNPGIQNIESVVYTQGVQNTSGVQNNQQNNNNYQ